MASVGSPRRSRFCRSKLLADSTNTNVTQWHQVTPLKPTSQQLAQRAGPSAHQQEAGAHRAAHADQGLARSAKQALRGFSKTLATHARPISLASPPPQRPKRGPGQGSLPMDCRTTRRVPTKHRHSLISVERITITHVARSAVSAATHRGGMGRRGGGRRACVHGGAGEGVYVPGVGMGAAAPAPTSKARRALVLASLLARWVGHPDSMYGRRGSIARCTHTHTWMGTTCSSALPILQDNKRRCSAWQRRWWWYDACKGRVADARWGAGLPSRCVRQQPWLPVL